MTSRASSVRAWTSTSPLQISNASHPAATACTAASGTVHVLAIAVISRSSLTMTPLKSSSSRSIPRTIAGESVAGRSSSSQGGYEDVRGHDERHIVTDRLAKRDELDAADTIRRMLHKRQGEMRIDRRIAMSWKVLAASGHAVLLEAASRSRRSKPRRRPRRSSSPSARSPITGFFGLVWMSRTGA